MHKIDTERRTGERPHEPNPCRGQASGLLPAAQKRQEAFPQLVCARKPTRHIRHELVRQRPEREREQKVRDIPPPDMLRRDRPVRVKKQRAAAEQKQWHRAAGQAVPEQPFQPVSAPDCATAQDIRRRVDEQNGG